MPAKTPVGQDGSWSSWVGAPRWGHGEPGAGTRAVSADGKKQVNEALTVIPDPNALQLAPDALPEKEELVLLKRGLRDIKKRLQQLNHVCAHQPAQELGQDRFSQTVLRGWDIATPWNERHMLTPPAWPIMDAVTCWCV